jgi:acyl-CoA dehydrogenase
MDFATSSEEQLIREAVRDISANYDREYWREHFETNTFPKEYWQELAEGGWLGTTIPEAYGGEGMGMQEMAVIIEELSRGGDLGASSTVFVLTPVFGGISIARHGTAEQRERYLPSIAAGKCRFAMALTEANAGVNTLNIQTSAQRDGDEWVVDGQKMWTSGAATADELLLVARTSPTTESTPSHGLTVFLVPEPADCDAVTLTPLDVEIPEFERQYQVDIDGLRIPADRVLGEVDAGLKMLWDVLNTERIAGASTAIGGGLRAIDLTVEYATDRVVFDGPIGSYQAIQHPIAEAFSKLQCAQLMTAQAAWEWDQEQDAGESANIAKLWASEAAFDAADHAIQTHGGNGFNAEYEVYDIWQILRLIKTAPVPNELIRNHIAEHALGLPRSY